MRLLKLFGILIGFGFIFLSLVGCGEITLGSTQTKLPFDTQGAIVASGKTAKEVLVLSESQYRPLALARRFSQPKEKPYTHVLFLKCDPNMTEEDCYKKATERPTPRIMLELAAPTTDTQAPSYKFTGNLMVVFQNLNPRFPYYCKPLAGWTFTTDKVAALPQVRKQNPPIEGSHTTATKLVDGVTWQCNIWHRARHPAFQHPNGCFLFSCGRVQ